MPIVQSINVRRGENIVLHFTMSPGKDITGWVISFTVAKAWNASNKTFQVTATITSGPNGTFDVIITSDQLNIATGTYYYDLFRTDPGNFRCLSVGEFIISEDVRFP